METITPVTHDLGDFKVRRALPAKSRTMVGPFIFVDQFGPARLAARRGHGRAPAPAHQPRHRHLSVRGRDRASRQPRHPAGDRAGRGQSDDRGQRHRPFRALAGRRARRRARRSTACRPGSRCPTARRRSTRRSSMSTARPAAGRGRRRLGAGADGHAVGQDRRRHRSTARPSMPTSSSAPARACRSTPRPTSAR